MKNIVLFVFCLASISSLAQDKIGVEAGVSFANMRGDGSPDSSKALISFYPSFFYEKEISSHFSLKGLVAYESKGYTFDFNYNDVYSPFDDPFFYENETVKLSSDYLTIGALGKFTFGNNIQFFVNAGPYVGLVIDKGGPSNSTDFGVLSGLGLEKNVGNFSIHLEGRNSLGFVNMAKGDLSQYVNTKTISFYLLTGVSYNL